MKSVVRIIGGHHRGKKIHFPDTLSLRPTPSRVRETLFNWLMHSIHGTRCLDAFAGSGALGFEAWSRGAGHVTFIEQSPTAFLNLKKQALAFKSSTLEPIQTDALTYLTHTHEQFNLIFLDPPFDKPALLNNSISLLEERNILLEQGLIYTESAQPITLNPAHWETLKEKKAGLIYYSLHQKK
jgi:16S rRNA (guanine966-N2)-methyltransferase